MNIRLAPNSFRIRVSQSEAKRLLEVGECREILPLPELQDGEPSKSEFAVTLVRTDGQEFNVQRTLAGVVISIDREALQGLLQAPPSREAFLRQALPRRSGGALEAIFEVDLFSRKEAGGPKQP